MAGFWGNLLGWWPWPRKIGQQWFYPIDGTPNIWQELNFLESYELIPEVNAVIGTKAAAFSNGRLIVVNDAGEEQKNDPINKILQNPNWFQAQKEFLLQSKTWHEIFGNEYLYMLFPFGFQPGKALQALYSLPPNLVHSNYNDTRYYWQIKDDPKVTYVLRTGGTESNLDQETIIHLNDNRVAIFKADGKYLLQGESRLKALTVAINNIRLAYESRGVILKNRGAMGVLSNATQDVTGAVPLLKKEKKHLDNIYSGYGGLNHQQQIIVTNANLKWQQMTVNPDKLGLFQEIEEDFYKVIDGFGMNIEWFCRSKGTTYENQKQARKGTYTDTIIPEANEFTFALNQRLMPEGSKNKIVMSYMHLPLFQEDLSARGGAVETMVNALSKALMDGAITIPVYQEELLRFGIGEKKF